MVVEVIKLARDGKNQYIQYFVWFILNAVHNQHDEPNAVRLTLPKSDLRHRDKLCDCPDRQM